MVWDRRIGMTVNRADIEAGVRALGLYGEELDALAEFARARAAFWDVTEGEHSEEFSGFWRRRAQRWNEMAAQEEHRQTRAERVS